MLLDRGYVMYFSLSGVCKPVFQFISANSIWKFCYDQKYCYCHRGIWFLLSCCDETSEPCLLYESSGCCSRIGFFLHLVVPFRNVLHFLLIANCRM